MYSPSIPIDISCTPPRKNNPTASAANPGTASLAKKRHTKTYPAYPTEHTATRSPNCADHCKGFSLNVKIPSRRQIPTTCQKYICGSSPASRAPARIGVPRLPEPHPAPQPPHKPVPLPHPVHFIHHSPRHNTEIPAVQRDRHMRQPPHQPVKSRIRHPLENIFPSRSRRTAYTTSNANRVSPRPAPSAAASPPRNLS